MTIKTLPCQKGQFVVCSFVLFFTYIYKQYVTIPPSLLSSLLLTHKPNKKTKKKGTTTVLLLGKCWDLLIVESIFLVILGVSGLLERHRLLAR